jgi:hypothetical protein
MMPNWGVCAVSDVYSENVKEFRGRTHGVGSSRLVFVDQTNMNEVMRPLRGLAPRGKPARVRSKSAPRYTPRIDVMAACHGHGVLPITFLVPDERKRQGVKGWTKKLVLKWVRKELGPAIDQLAIENMVVVFDKGLSMKSTQALTALQQGGCQHVAEVWIMETGIAKHCSPLDNALWHEWKEKVRKQEPVSELSSLRIGKREWNDIPISHVEGYYRKCALTRGSDVSSGLD